MRAPAEQLVFARGSGGYGRGSAREPRDDGSERRGPSKKLIIRRELCRFVSAGWWR